MQSMKINIDGIVYRTGYRYFIKQIASQFNITGCVFYCPDLSVEILAEGENDELDQFVTLCKMGNQDSQVEEIHMSEITPCNFDSFEVIELETSLFKEICEKIISK